MNAQSVLRRVGESRTKRHIVGLRQEWKNIKITCWASQSVVGIWNELPEEIVEAGTIATFKRDKYMDG